MKCLINVSGPTQFLGQIYTNVLDREINKHAFVFTVNGVDAGKVAPKLEVRKNYNFTSMRFKVLLLKDLDDDHSARPSKSH